MKSINQIILTIIVSQGMMLSPVFSDNKVDISPVISNGWGGEFKNAPSNMWLTLDQSMSMTTLSGRGFKMKEGMEYEEFDNTDVELGDENYQKYVKNLENLASYSDGYVVDGIVDYDEDTVYQIPVDYKGQELPLPSDVNNTWDIIYDRTVGFPSENPTFFESNGKLKPYEDIYSVTHETRKIKSKDANGEYIYVDSDVSNNNIVFYKKEYEDQYSWNPVRRIPRDIFQLYAQYNWGVKMCYRLTSDWMKGGKVIGINAVDSVCQLPIENDSIDSALQGKTFPMTPAEFGEVLEKTKFNIPIKELYKSNGKIFKTSIHIGSKEALKDNPIIKAQGKHSIIPGLWFSGFVMVADDTCEKAVEKAVGDKKVFQQKNCQIWKTFYSTKILAVKSGLSLALYKNLINEDGSYKDIRYGYQALQHHRSDTITDGQIAKKFHELASNYVNPIQLKVNNEENLKNFYEWLFAFTPSDTFGSTPLRTTMVELLNEIKDDARGEGRLFLENPSQPFNEQTNNKYTCRLNHNIMFTDGAWNDNSIENNNDYNKNVTTEKTFQLPYIDANTGIENPGNDGYTQYEYKPMFPYKSETRLETAADSMIHLADLAFKAWATDLDNKKDNNVTGQSGSMIVPDENKLETYIKSDGTYGVYKNQGKAFWHPFYDLATWQHINTHTIGFGLDETEYKDIHTNPPATQEEAKKVFIMKENTTCTNADQENKETCKDKEAVWKAVDLMIEDGIDRQEFIDGKEEYKFAKNSFRLKSSNAITDMARTAMAGRGLFFNAKGGKDVVKAFDEIMARVSKDPDEKAGTTGAAGTSISSKNIGNAYLTTRYDSHSFTGDLLKQEMYNGENPEKCFEDYNTDEDDNAHEKRTGHRHLLGDFCDKLNWSAAKQLRDMDYDKRKIFTVKIKSSGIKLTEIVANSNLASNTKLSYELMDFADDAFKISETLADNDTVSLYQRNQILDGINGDKETKKIFASISANDNIFANNEKLSALFKYIRGSSSKEQVFDVDCQYQEGTGIFRSRSQYHYDYNNPLSEDKCGTERNILGALVRSSAVFAGKPNLTLAYLSKTGDAYQNYRKNVIAKYNATGSDKKNEVMYINANDGMLHAFDSETGDELFAYVPVSIYNRLAQTVVPKRQLSLVDGKITIQWVNTGNSTTDNDKNDTWKQFLVSGFGGGGKGIYALDVTSTTTIDGAWEYSDLQSRIYNNKNGNRQGKSNVGNIMWEPAIVQLQDNTWAMVTGNGYNAESGKAVLIVLDLVTGKPIQELELPNTLDNQPNGLSQLYFAGYPKAEMKKINFVDRAYAGDLQGNLWVFDFTKADKNGGVEIVHNKPLFTATGKIDTGKKDAKGNPEKEEVLLPITAKPLVIKHPNGGYLVHFGTGALFSVQDLSNKVPNALYGIWDDWIPTDKGGTEHPRNTTISEGDLNLIKMKETTGIFNGKTVKVRYLANNKPTTWTMERGWKINLTFNKKGSERAWQPPKMTYGALSQDVINYRTVRYIDNEGSKEQCGGGDAGVEGWDMVFNPADAGKRLRASAIDANDDSLVNDQDMIKVSDGEGGEILVPITGKRTKGYFETNETDAPLVKKGVRACELIISSSTGSSSKIRKKAIPVCSYVSSWRELREEKKK